jgi:hypothetical protein
MNHNGFKNNFSNWDYTLDKYDKLCNAIVLSKYTCVPVASYLQLEPKNKSYIIMRHDIDRTPQRALEIAKVEHKYNISGTYYFRAQRGTYAPDIMDKIVSLGHEIGFHYETVDKCKGDLEAASELFKKELANFRRRYEVRTVCAHGNPLTKYDNKDIWKTIRLDDMRLLGEAFLALDFNKFAYFSDSGRTWLKNKSQKMQGKDDVNTAFEYMRPKCTDDVINIIKDGKLPNICILTHCERWSKDIMSFSSRYLFDFACSWGKVAIYIYRKVNGQ